MPEKDKDKKYYPQYVGVPQTAKTRVDNDTIQKNSAGEIYVNHVPANHVTYDNTTSGLAADDVQNAIDELDMHIDKFEAKFELIEEITLKEDVASIERTQTPDGKNYNFRSLYIEFEVPQYSDTNYIRLSINNEFMYRITNAIRSISNTVISSFTTIFGGKIISLYSYPAEVWSGNTGGLSPLTSNNALGHITVNSITNITLTTPILIPQNTKIKIYGIWA